MRVASVVGCSHGEREREREREVKLPAAPMSQELRVRDGGERGRSRALCRRAEAARSWLLCWLSRLAVTVAVMLPVQLQMRVCKLQCGRQSR